MIFSSPLELGSRLTSGFGQRWGTLHAGSDYGPPEPGQLRRPVYAVADMTILRVGRGNGKWDSSGAPYHSGLYVYGDMGWIGGDRMRAYYGHLDEYIVKPGQRVKVGDLIGYMGGSGASGANDFAVHLHFGISQNHDRPVYAATTFGAPGWINAHLWLKSKGITVGWDAPLLPIEPASVTKPKPTTGIPEVGQGAIGKHVRSDDAIRNICVKAGHGNYSTPLGLLIERYQHRQQAPYTLPHDRHWGTRTDKHYRWTLVLQRRLNLWKGDDIPVDGDYGKVTVARIREVQENNKGGTYKGIVDGVAGPMFCAMLGIGAHP